MSATLELVEALISRASVTPDDAGCLDLFTQRLEKLGFLCERMDSGPEQFRVSNLWAKRSAGPNAPTLVFAGHTDVVPTGPLDKWRSPPFVPSHRDGLLYGRGAADMKSSLAAMVVATEAFLADNPHPALSIAFLLTSDEEGPSKDGTLVVVNALEARAEKLDFCIVGEPTSVTQLGDMVKNGRRGSLSGKLRVKGVQGHIAYPHLARNPIAQFAPAMAELVATVWDAGNAFFPATTWQMSNIHAGTGANNVIPGELVVDFNFRFSTESTAQGLQSRLEAVLHQHGLDFEISWALSGQPFLTTPGELVQAMRESIDAQTGLATELSTTGGTSDGRFIARICPQIVEFGPVNASIHQIDEHVAVASLDPLKNIYQGVLQRLDAVARA
jgi:succinyl-diaminopimelate desuccinylase